jgi:thiol:disulfide interchange protein
MIRPIRLCLTFAAAALLFSAGNSLAQVPGLGSDESLAQLVTAEMRAVPEVARPGEQVRLVTTAKVKPGWHIYSVLPQAEFGPFPTSIVTDAPGFTTTGPVYETNPTHQKDTAFGLDLWFHTRAARFYQNLTARTDDPVGTRTVEQRIKFQTCNDRFCTPPRTEKLQATVRIEAGPVRPEYAQMVRTVDYLDNSGHFQEDANSLEGALSGGLLSFLGLAAGFGLLALLTPCVFPMIPVTVTFFTAHTKAGRGVWLALLFGVGLVVSYTGLGLGITFLAGTSGVGQFANSPWVNLLVAAFFILFAFALAGWIAPALPATWVSALDRSASRVQGPIGVILMGVAFTAANFTCTIPFVGTLLLAASQGQVLWPLVGMLVYSTVFALPFVALALFPRWLTVLRGKSGPWLTQLKLILALLEIGAALKFVSNADVIEGWGIVNREALLGLWALISVACGVILLRGSRRPTQADPSVVARAKAWIRSRFFPAERPSPWIILGRTIPGVAFLALAAYLVVGMTGRELDSFTEAYVPPRVSGPVAGGSTGPEVGAVANLPWNRSLEQALATSRATGKPIFIDFTGYTCVNCRWMEKRVFAQDPVLDEFRNRFVLLQLFTDGGPDGEKNQRLQVERFRTLALPYYVILAPDNAVLGTHAGILPSIPGFLDFLANGTRATPASKIATTPDAGSSSVPKRS